MKKCVDEKKRGKNKIKKRKENKGSYMGESVGLTKKKRKEGCVSGCWVRVLKNPLFNNKI